MHTKVHTSMHRYLEVSICTQKVPCVYKCTHLPKCVFVGIRNFLQHVEAPADTLCNKEPIHHPYL